MYEVKKYDVVNSHSNSKQLAMEMVGRDMFLMEEAQRQRVKLLFFH